MAHLGRNRAVRWVAPVALVGAVGLIACGDDSSDVTARTASAPAAVVGSDVHLENRAADIADQVLIDHLDNQADAMAVAARINSGSDVHLENQSADIEARLDSGSDVHLANQAAEAAERQAHLAGNAATHAAQDDTSDSSDDEFVPGSRRMPVR